MTEKIAKYGWEVFDVESIDDFSLLEISKRYGTSFPDSNGNLIQTLKAKEKGTGIRNSFSYNFGFSSIPFHTDAAFNELPARYILFTSILPSETTTNIIDLKFLSESLNDDELTILKKAIFLIKTPQEQKFSNLFFNNYNGLRFDPNIMFPYNSYAKKSLEIIDSQINNLEPVRINWNKKSILIIDNWRCLHSRGKIEDKNRTLKRIYIK